MSATSSVSGGLIPSKGAPRVTKRSWTQTEDAQLMRLVVEYGAVNWTLIAERLVNRSGKQCRERYHNHLQPDIKKGDWSEEEDRILVEMHAKLGNQWAKITKHLPGRTDNAVKNRWHTVHNQQTESNNQRSSSFKGHGVMMNIPMLSLTSTLKDLDLSPDLQTMTHCHGEHGHEITLTSRSSLSTEDDNIPLSSRLSQSIFDDPSILATCRMTPRSGRFDDSLLPFTSRSSIPGQTPRSARSPRSSPMKGSVNNGGRGLSEIDAQGFRQLTQRNGADERLSVVPSLKKAFQLFNRASPTKALQSAGAPKIFSARGNSTARSEGPETNDVPGSTSARDLNNFQDLWEETPRVSFESEMCLAGMEGMEISQINTARSANWVPITARSATDHDNGKGPATESANETSIDSNAKTSTALAEMKALNMQATNSQALAAAVKKKGIPGISPRQTPRDSLLPSLDVKKKRSL